VKKRPTYLELGRRVAFGRPVKKTLGPFPPPPDPASAPDFDLGTWRVRPALGRMTRADRILALDSQTLTMLLLLSERPPGGVNRDELAVRVFGLWCFDDHREKFRRCMGYLRHVFSEDGSVRIVNAPGDCYELEIGEPVPGRAIRSSVVDVLMVQPTAVESWLKRGRRRGLSVTLAAVIVVAMTAGLFMIIGRGHRVTFDQVIVTRPFATEPGENTSPSLSPDGTRVVYRHKAPDGSETLMLRTLTGGTAAALTHGDGHDDFPAWSPKGDWIAFERTTPTNCEVLVMSPSGGDPKKLGDCDFGAGGPISWQPDGKAIVYSHRTAWSLPDQLVSVAIDDGRMIGVTNPTAGMPGDRSPALSPTGVRLAFVRSRALGVADLSYLVMGGAEAKKGTSDGVPLAGLAWEPAGLSLLIASSRGGQDALWRTHFDGANPELVLSLPDPIRAPALTRDGQALLYERWHVKTRFMRHDASGSHPSTELTGWPALAGFDRGAQISPDGKTVVFVSNRTGHDQLWTMPVAGGSATLLTRADADYLETPRWSRDGRVVAYTASLHGALDVWSVDVASGTSTRLTHDGRSRAPSFSRDGQWIYVGSARTGGRWQLWRQPWPDGGKAEQLTRQGGLAAIESMDGSTLYFVRPDRQGLWQRTRDPDSDDALLTPDLAAIDWRNWEVTDEAIWFIARGTDTEATLARYLFSQGRVLRGGTVPALLPDSGLAVLPDGSATVIAEGASTQVDLEVATIRAKE